MNRSTFKRAAVVSLSAALVSLAAACGGSDSGKGGDVLKIGVVQEASGAYASDYLTEWGVGAKAAVDYINEELDGFGGRKVELITCDSQSSAAGALNCANRFVAEKVAFVTGLGVNWGANGIAVLEKAKIPSQTGPISVQDASSTVSYPYGGGIYTELGAATSYAVNELGAKNVAAVVSEGPGADIFFKLYREPVDKIGGEFTKVSVPATGDLSPSIAKAVGAKPDVIVTPLGNAQLVTYYEGLRQQGFDMSKVISVGAAVDAENFFDNVTDKKSLEGTIYTYEFKSPDDTSDPEVKIYRDAMKKYAGIEGRGEFFQWSFATVMTNYKIAEKSGFDTFDAASLVKTLENEKVQVFMGNEYSKKDYAAKETPGVGSPWIRLVQYRDGKVHNLNDGWINGYTGEVMEDSSK